MHPLIHYDFRDVQIPWQIYFRGFNFKYPEVWIVIWAVYRQVSCGIDFLILFPESGALIFSSFAHKKFFKLDEPFRIFLQEHFCFFYCRNNSNTLWLREPIKMLLFLESPCRGLAPNHKIFPFAWGLFPLIGRSRGNSKIDRICYLSINWKFLLPYMWNCFGRKLLLKQKFQFYSKYYIEYSYFAVSWLIQ